LGSKGASFGAEDWIAKVRGVLNLVVMNLERITLDPAVMSGKPCIRGLRVTVANVLRQLANQRTVPQILEAYPYLESADIDACLGYAALRVDDEELVLSAA
jgi:uncharacterized protein (DUF433 family)